MSFNFSDGTTQSSATGILEKIWVPCDGRTVSTKSGSEHVQDSLFSMADEKDY